MLAACRQSTHLLLQSLSVSQRNVQSEPHLELIDVLHVYLSQCKGMCISFIKAYQRDGVSLPWLGAQEPVYMFSIITSS